MTSIGKFWRGEVSLGRAFWFFGVVVFLLIYAAVRLLAPLFLSPFSVVVGLGGGRLIYALLIAALVLLPQIAYQSFATVGIWRSSEAYRGPLLQAFLCRLILVLAISVTVSDTVVALVTATPALRQQFLLNGTTGIFAPRGR